LIEVIINLTLLAFLAITAVAIVRLSNLFAIIMMYGMFSFLSALLFIVMDAVDVAFTEAAVGAGLSSLILALALRRLGLWQIEGKVDKGNLLRVSAKGDNDG
jgi:multicomponent Na+:H+ antiporter subunit B